MMSSSEESLHARAEMLDETSDLAAEVTEVLDGASGSGVDPAAVTSLRAAVRALDPAGGTPAYQAERPGDGYHSDVEFLEAVTDAEDQVRERLREAGALRDEAAEAMDKAQDDLGRSRRALQDAQMALAAAMALPTYSPCRNGCHPYKASAIEQAERAVADAEQAIADAERRIGTLDSAIEILDELIRRLTAAAQALHQVPADLGETYELVAEFIRRGGQMTHDGRFITGDGDTPFGSRRPKDQPRRSDEPRSAALMPETGPPAEAQSPAQPQQQRTNPMDAKHAAKTRALARAKTCAWIVAVLMTGTTMTFQVYHSIRFGQMPVPLAVLEGVVPLLISMCILEFVSEWEGARTWAVVAAYVIMAGSMYMSAAATGAVVLHAAPHRMSWLFGVLLDAAALLAVHFILNGPTAADVAREASAEAAARAEHEASLRAEIAAAKQARKDDRSAFEEASSALRAELHGERAAREAAETGCAEAVAGAEITARQLEAARAEITARKKRAATARKRGPATGRKQDAATGSATVPQDLPDEAAPDDLDSEAKVLWYLDKGHSASKAGVYAGLTDSRGRQIARLAKQAPRDTVDAPNDNDATEE